MDTMSIVVAESEELPKVLADYIAAKSAEAVAKHGAFVVAVSGGSMGAVLGAGLVGRDDVAFDKWKVIFADERCVELTHEDSNYGGCDKALFSKLDKLPRDSILTIDESVVNDPAEAATRYEAALQKVSKGRIDLALLGMGPDGHTASLFPGHALVDSKDGKLVQSITDSPKPPPAATRVAFVATGDSKADVFGDIMKRRNPAEATSDLYVTADERYPASLISDDATWFVDAAAISRISVMIKAPSEDPFDGL